MTHNFDHLSSRLGGLKQQLEAERDRRGFVYVASAQLPQLIARVGALTEMAIAIEQALVDERASNRSNLNRFVKHQQTVSMILFLMQADITDSNVIPFRPRPQSAPQHPTGGDAA